MDATLMFSAPATPQPAPSAHASATVAGAVPNASRVDVQSDPGRASDTPRGRIFAGLMRGLLPTHERQKVAAAPETANTEAGDLKTEVLGDQLNLITTSNAQPDPGSLSAFARAQGLDEAAVKALFGDMAAQDQAPSDAAQLMANMAAASESATTSADIAWLASQLSAEISLQVSGARTAANTASAISALAADASLNLPTNGMPVALFPVPTPSAAMADTTPMTPTTGDTDVAALMGWNLMANAQPVSAPAASLPTEPVDLENTLSVMPLGTAPGAADRQATIAPLSLSPLPSVLPTMLKPSLEASLTPPPLPTTAMPAASLLPATPSEMGKTAVDSPGLVGQWIPAALGSAMPNGVKQAGAESAVTATEALSVLAPTAPKPEDALRIRLVPAWSVVTQQLNQMSGTALTSAWGALKSATLGAPTRSVALDLSTPLASDSEEDNQSSTDSGWSRALLDLNRPGATNTPLPTAVPVPGMAQTLRQEQYQQLADRLGRAMAERLQSQIARGEWKLQMRLNPSNLGRIDVELDMHANGLDAMFRSENPLTRELMVQSMPKLKDTLSQSGMAVASVWVNSDAGRQSDGNPTPQKDRRDVTDTSTSAQADAGVVPATTQQRSSDGFDVLA